MASLNIMVKRVSGLTDNDTNEWERKFIASIVRQTNDGDNTTSLSEKQIESLERIFDKHFAA